MSGALLTNQELHLVVFRKIGALAGLLPDQVIVHELGTERLRWSLIKLVIMLRKLKPSIIYSTHGYVNVALLLLRAVYGRSCKLLLREANTPSRSLASQRFTTFFKIAYRFFYPKAEKIICQSKLMLDEFKRDYDIPVEKMELIYNPTNTTEIRSNLKPIRKTDETVQFVAAGFFHYKKGFDRLIDWFSEVPSPSRLTLLGSGPEEASLVNKIKKYGLEERVNLPGYIASPWDYFAAADAFLLPSRWEGMPNVALEALACGTPVIATAESGGINDLADMAIEGAVIVSHSSNDFINAMRAVRYKSVDKIKPSLLPIRFELIHAQTCFNKLLTGMVGDKNYL